MARLDVHIPDELAEQAKSAELNISALTQAAIADELQRRATDSWLASLPEPRNTVSHDTAMNAL